MIYKKLLLLSLSIFISHSIKAEDDESWWSFFGWFSIKQEQPKNQKSEKKPVDYARVRQEFRSGFDHAFSTSYQSEEDQTTLTYLREKSSNNAIEMLQHQYGNLSQQESKQQARELARTVALEFVAENAETMIREELTRISYRGDSEYLVKTTKEEILREATQEMYKEDGPLRYYVGESLRKKVRQKIQASGNPYAQQPSAPPMEYEKPSTPIIEIFANNDRNMKVYRDECCSVCLESFADLKRRVILPCGHDICPKCFKDLRDRNMLRCPKRCPNYINLSDFPSI